MNDHTRKVGYPKNRIGFVHFNTLFFGSLIVGCTLWLSGCGSERLGLGSEPTSTPTWAPVATFTPTPLPQHTNTPTHSSPTPVQVVVLPTITIPVPVAVTPESLLVLTPTAVMAPSETITENSQAIISEATPTSLPGSLPTLEPAAAQLVVIADAANVRSGPSTDYPQIGVVMQNATYPVTGRNEQGDWWKFCCINDQTGWLFSPLVTVQNPEMIAVTTPPIPPPPVPVAQAIQEEAPPTAESVPAVAEPVDTPEAATEDAAPVAPSLGEHSGTAGNFDPNAQYQIVHYRVLGFDDNNGGIFNKGGQQFIFLTVLDENGNGINGAVVKDAVGDKLNIVTGDKGAGKNEIKMDWDPYKLYVAADSTGPVTSQISNQMNNPYPHIPDVVGLLGPPENEYAICPTVDDRCTPPFYHAHWSYEITFQKVR